MSKIPDYILKDLNKEQTEAVSLVDGPLLVLAGAGTGKTRVITYRIANMIHYGIHPENIAGMTFTNKAAIEMRERLDRLVQKEKAKKVFLGTFHSFCCRILRKEISVEGWTSNFTIADESDQVGIIKQAINETGFSKEELDVQICLSYISRSKSNLRTSRELRNAAEHEIQIKALRVYERYNQILKTQNMLDFDDLLSLTVTIWKKHPEILEKYHDIYRYLLIDEYQDTNFVQFHLLKLLAGKNGNICVVGDDDQSIYGWRGADIGNILNFPKHFPGCKQVKLEQNYRSTNNILNAAHGVISRNESRYEKKLWSAHDEGEKIQIISTEDDEGEASFIANMIHGLTGSDSEVSYNSIAVLYRSNYQSRLIENAMRDSRLPYRLVGAKSFYERREIRDAVAYLKLITNPKDDQSLLRIISVPPRGIGDKAVEAMKKMQGVTFQPFTEIIEDNDILKGMSGKGSAAAKHFSSCLKSWRHRFSEPGSLSEKVNDYFKEIGFLDCFQKLYKDRSEALKRQENVYELINAIAGFESRFENAPSLTEFLEQFALYDDNDKVDNEAENAEAVTLMTVHAAKGLEFDHVFIAGLENNIFPHERSLLENMREEERRLFYVALTRAKRKVLISWSKKRMRYGKQYAQSPSEFLYEIPENLSEFIDARDTMRPMTDQEYENAFSSFFENYGAGKSHGA